MPDRRVAFYARVSTESQARDNTIASQIMALRERVSADGGQLEPDHAYVDEGYSGSLLIRPALERLRDAAAAGSIERIHVLAPDRLARRHAHQALLMEEFRRAGTEVVFLNRHGQQLWYASTLRGMLNNTAYIGRAVYGHSRYLPASPRLRRIRGHPHPSARPTSRVAVPREEWIEVPVPALVDEAMFEAAQSQLAENRKRKRDGLRGPRWLLQGLTVCRRCGYAFYGKTVPKSSKDRSKGEYRHYRCIGTDGYRVGGVALCSNRSVRADHLEQAVGERVCALLEAPNKLADEYRPRLHEASNSTVRADELAQLGQQTAALQRGIGRLIDSYAAGVIDRSEFKPRIAGLRSRVAQLQNQQRAAAEGAEAERELTLIMGQLDDFATKVRHSLQTLDRISTREIIRTIVRRIEIDRDHVEVIFRVPPPVNGSLSPQPNRACDPPPLQQDCTAGRRANHRLAEPVPPVSQGLGMPEPQGTRSPASRLHPAHAAKTMPNQYMIPDRHLGIAASACSLKVSASGSLTPETARAASQVAANVLAPAPIRVAVRSPNVSHSPWITGLAAPPPSAM